MPLSLRAFVCALRCALALTSIVLVPGVSAAQGFNGSERLPPLVSVVGDESGVAPGGNWIESSEWDPWTASQVTVPQRWYAGAELLVLRPHMSEPIAFISGRGVGDTAVGKIVDFDFDYQASPKVFLGYRSPETGNALQFSYWYYRQASTASFVAQSNDEGFIPDVYLPFGDFGGGAGGRGAAISEELALRLNVYDIDLFLPYASDDGLWLLTASAGARIVDYSQSWRVAMNDSSNTFVLNQSIGLDFIGAGPRVGLEARRNFGLATAVYMRGDFGMILGQRTGTLTSSPFGNDAPGLEFTESVSRLVTVSDLELGGTWAATNNLFLTLGYTFQAWTDLSGLGRNLNLSSNSNLLSFDGLIARAAVSY